ncbi:hypothetical protein OUZ56_022247 [Daphnia magna]|uniref:Secreted protein n=1 Tax=Daphnia magna TaxID=35525 RepID=A0ABR0AVS9_9CRUS|nr:hypothetical protein OUZ56_022247 [Daphnia magna]
MTLLAPSQCALATAPSAAIRNRQMFCTLLHKVFAAFIPCFSCYQHVQADPTSNDSFNYKCLAPRLATSS